MDSRFRGNDNCLFVILFKNDYIWCPGKNLWIYSHYRFSDFFHSFAKSLTDKTVAHGKFRFDLTAGGAIQTFDASGSLNLSRREDIGGADVAAFDTA